MTLSKKQAHDLLQERLESFNKTMKWMDEHKGDENLKINCIILKNQQVMMEVQKTILNDLGLGV